VSKSALIRECVEHQLPEPYDNGLWAIGQELSKLFADVEPVEDIDEYLYGSPGQET
jgi:hypothetical protein